MGLSSTLGSEPFTTAWLIGRHILNAAVTACAAGLQPKLAQRIVKDGMLVDDGLNIFKGYVVLCISGFFSFCGACPKQME